MLLLNRIELLNQSKKILLSASCIFCFSLAFAASKYEEITWDKLMPKDFDQYTMYDALDFSSYNIQTLGDDDPEAQRLYADLMAIHEHTPMEPSIEGLDAKLPGFIVPLEMEDDLVTSFFLVPYYGACIHTPPPPPNQMVYVETDGIKLKSLEDPVWVSGRIELEKVTNEVGIAGYVMHTNLVESYYK
ncbi:DUF3299 domain-containing protein [Reinekea thalattae]|uniref:DUF3299 domain-containing protein n=1 Tax=Reinekea thalattae TaxID=2593301 RepID=A0A5C8Z273_9GAMM|nr:DUF3299 domain-containing protein [Reinekea thalattae]TXR51349.1 DUF3299 domain-containing protein [Reinekea thalattae]